MQEDKQSCLKDGLMRAVYEGRQTFACHLASFKINRHRCQAKNGLLRLACASERMFGRQNAHELVHVADFTLLLASLQALLHLGASPSAWILELYTTN